MSWYEGIVIIELAIIIIALLAHHRYLFDRTVLLELKRLEKIENDLEAIKNKTSA